MPPRSMTTETARTIRERWASGATYPELMREFGIGSSTLWALLSNKTYPAAAMPVLRRRRRDAGLPTREELEAWSEPEPNTGCLIWMRAWSSKDYGSIYVRGRVEKAHRIAYVVAHGYIPRSRQVLHKCDTPPCINERHLFLGTNDDNVRDRCTKGRSSHQGSPCPFPAGEGHPKAKLTWPLVREIRARYASGDGTQRSLAAEYGVTNGAISALLIGRSWKERA